ncbi:hypothetical protein [Adhaeribacter pallidiroseus]|uniref:Uncharacterized protein n=1 Tax=Adhaeribacter pallidiroseus TaxID=2072847 RepID=A0A369QHJ3_9BACT|nr:hypothetical protein [Adhaeribacter pallidiroseus]RDC63760.1 hypothetical protein AHMF7616_02368 [Adhaeribacter pallidiroseus]
MKYFLLSWVFFLIKLGCCQAQSVDGITLKDLDVEYVEIVGKDKVLSNQQTIGLDYGQVKSTSSLNPYRDTKIKDANGNEIKFKYMIEALNFMTKNGFEFVPAYTSVEEDRSIYHYLLKKKN